MSEESKSIIHFNKNIKAVSDAMSDTLGIKRIESFPEVEADKKKMDEY